MRIFVVFVFSGLFCLTGFSQNNKLLSQNFEIDTSVVPDYFEVKITTCENTFLSGSGRKLKTEKLNLDSSIKNLKANLLRLGFNNSLRKLSIDEIVDSYGRKNYFNGQILFQVKFELIVSSKDSVDYLFEKLPKENITSIIITPKLSANTIEIIKEKLSFKAINSMKKFVQNVADTIGKKIVSQNSISFNFYTKNNYVTQNLNGPIKDFIIETKDIECFLSFHYTYTIENKN